MPELPEVEVVKRSLTNKIKNLVIKRVKVNDDRLRYLIAYVHHNPIHHYKERGFKDWRY